MITTMCLAPSALMTFLTYLDLSKVTMDESTVTIHASAGPVEWIYIKELDVYAIDGNIAFCVNNSK